MHVIAYFYTSSKGRPAKILTPNFKTTISEEQRNHFESYFNELSLGEGVFLTIEVSTLKRAGVVFLFHSLYKHQNITILNHKHYDSPSHT